MREETNRVFPPKIVGAKFLPLLVLGENGLCAVSSDSNTVFLDCNAVFMWKETFTALQGHPSIMGEEY